MTPFRNIFRLRRWLRKTNFPLWFKELSHRFWSKVKVKSNRRIFCKDLVRFSREGCQGTRERNHSFVECNNDRMESRGNLEEISRNILPLVLCRRSKPMLPELSEKHQFNSKMKYSKWMNRQNWEVETINDMSGSKNKKRSL